MHTFDTVFQEAQHGRFNESAQLEHAARVVSRELEVFVRRAPERLEGMRGWL
jgi:hypothetical protein